MQLADLTLWPVCKAGYLHTQAYAAMRKAGRIVDQHIDPEERGTLGVKYSCWEQVGRTP